MHSRQNILGQVVIANDDISFLQLAGYAKPHGPLRVFGGGLLETEHAPGMFQQVD
jgi:hypothetical protein